MAVWFITGASRGFGLEIARQALERGHFVVGTARDPHLVEKSLAQYADRLLAVELDVVREEQAGAAVAAAMERFGRIDVLVNNAGRGLIGAVEEASDAVVRAIYDTNVFGVLNVSRAVLPVMREQRSGRVINISSDLGFVGSPGWGIYASTKFAMEGYSEAMRAELEPLGVKVVLIEPGYFRTDFLDSRSLHPDEGQIADYADTSGVMRRSAPSINHAQLGDPAKAAAAILRIAAADVPPQRLQLGSDSFAAMERKIEQLRTESAAWRDLSLSTDHDDVRRRG